MRWYAIANGPLRALKVLLDSPLEFDPEEYIDRTFADTTANEQVSSDLKALASVYNTQRQALFPRIGSIHQALSNTAKINAKDKFEDISPLTHGFSDSSKSSLYSSTLKNTTCNSVNLQLDRLLENFKVSDCSGQRFNSRDLSDFVTFYLLSEVLFFALTLMADIKIAGNTITISPADKEIESQLRRKWFANYWEEISAASSIAYIDILPQGAERSSNFEDAIYALGLNFRDKIFSIPASSLPSKLEKSVCISWMTKLSNLVTLCIWCQKKNQMQHAPYALLERIQITKKDIEKLSELLGNYSQPDRIFSFQSNGIKIDNPSFTNQLRIIINDLANALSENQLNNMLGDFFEKDYLKKYFSNSELKNHYRVHQGILAHEVLDTELKPDVDLIVEDLRRERFYFIQVKYLKIGGKAYISGDLDHLVSGKLSKGLKQITDAKMAMELGKLDKLLAARDLGRCYKDNSTFMMVHNISNFDFCLWPTGVVSYEWNSLRNLLKDGEVRHGHTQKGTNIWKSSKPLPIENPDSLVDEIINDCPASSLSGANTLFEAANLVVKFSVGNTKIECLGMGL